MYRFLLRPRWLAFHALVLVGVIVMVNLGFWQLRRLDERREFNAEVAESIDQDPVPLLTLADDPDLDLDETEWSQVTTTGTYLAEQIVVFNRSQGGVAGDNVLTPLVLDDGRIVLVNRGFVPLGQDVPPPPPEEVEVLGRIRPSQSRQRGELTDSGGGPVTEVRRVEIERIAPQLPGDVLPIYLDLIASRPPMTAQDPAPVPAPELDEGPHLSYAAQWFIFALSVIVGWVLAVRKSTRTHRRELGQVTGEPNTPTGAGAEPATAGLPPAGDTGVIDPVR